MVFQNYALYPHMNAYKNMGFALKMRGLPKDEIDRRVREAARILGLTDSLQKKPRTLSGGQRQRVAMGRAIVRKPQAFLMDEPLSNLDAKLRVEMRAEIARIQRDLGVTTVYVTHDQTEAMTMGDRVAVMRTASSSRSTTPQVLYERPRNLFVAEFIGSPAMNLVLADLAREDGDLWVQFGEHRLRLRRGGDAPSRPRSFDGRSVVLGIRPEDMEDASLDEEARRPTVDSRSSATSARTWARRSTCTSTSPPSRSRRRRCSRRTSWTRRGRGDEDRSRAGAGNGSRASSPGSSARLVRGSARRSRSPSTSERLHFFDPETGLNVDEATGVAP